jgi:phosphate/sulfate permease
MGIEIFVIAVVILFAFAVLDLIVGVSNDAVNFLNSSIGSRVAPRYIIMLIAGTGIIAGVIFSSGMMEVARKGIFHPQLFTMPEIMTIFLAVMLTDIILLDLFNTYGLPTSTTVSIVFELLGGAVAVSILKIMEQEHSIVSLAGYINTSKAMIIIFGILLSVIIAFICGAIVQFFSRLLFSFDYIQRLKRYGALWGGIALASITYFILVKGAKGATFISADQAEWIENNAYTILLIIFAVSAVILQLLLFIRINILKPIVLIGTFALAMAFAANDLVNFIGVPLAGFHAYLFASASSSPLTATMDALAQSVPTESLILILAGLIMVITLWVSKKARTVTDTEVKLGYQGEGEEKFESVLLSRTIVRMVIALFDVVKKFIPLSLQRLVAKRLDATNYKSDIDAENRPAFDLMRASVNLMVASAVISYATSQKLPLSTTYVTFMVAMGTSFADLAWGRESAVYRVTGVLTVIGGWFMTAMLAFTISGIIAAVIFYTQFYGILGLMLIAGLIIWKNHLKHSERIKSTDLDRVFNLKKVTDVKDTISVTFEQMGYLLKEVRECLDNTLNALYNQNGYLLRIERKRIGDIQRWANIITANIFKTIRLMEKEHIAVSHEYGQTVRRLQKLVDGTRDIVIRSYFHVSNHHKGLLVNQINDLKAVQEILLSIISDVEMAINKRDMRCYDTVVAKNKTLRGIAKSHNQTQIERIRNGESKTRLSILFYAIIGNAMMLAKQNLKLLEIFSSTLIDTDKLIPEFDMD